MEYAKLGNMGHVIPQLMFVNAICQVARLYGRKEEISLTLNGYHTG